MAKPRNNWQRHIAFEIDPLFNAKIIKAKNIGLTKKDLLFIERKFHNFGWIKYNKIRCVKCGHIHNNKDVVAHVKSSPSLDKTYHNCPKCKRKLLLEYYEKSSESKNVIVIGKFERFKDFQLYRTFEVHQRYDMERTTYSYHELQRNYIHIPTGKLGKLSVPRSGSYYSYGSSINGTLEFRHNPHNVDTSHDIDPYRVHPDFIRNGYNTDLVNQVYPEHLLSALVAVPYVETMIKNGDEDIFVNLIRDKSDWKSYLPSVKIALRHGFDIRNDIISWKDHIRMLKELDMDLLNPKHVAPKDFGTYHYEIYEKHKKQREKRQEIQKRKWKLQKIKAELKRAEEEKQKQKEFIKHHAKFSDLLLIDGDMVIRALTDKKDYEAEGDALHHCLHQTNYLYNFAVVMLSASVKDQRVQTIEYSLTNEEILQCRGDWNNDDEFTEKARELVNNNKDLIKQYWLGLKQKKIIEAA